MSHVHTSPHHTSTATEKYVATLQFTPGPGSPAVTGEWGVPQTARRVYRDWIGLYGDQATVVIQLIKENNGHQTVLRTWTKEHGDVAATETDLADPAASPG